MDAMDANQTEGITKAQWQETDASRIFGSFEDYVRILSTLRLLHVDSVHVSFSGGGDNGSVDNVYAYDADGKEVWLPDEELPFTKYVEEWDKEKRSWVKRPTAANETIPEILKTICESALQDCGLDWYNNDGGQGNLVIDFKHSPPAIELEVGINYTNTEDHVFTF